MLFQNAMNFLNGRTRRKFARNTYMIQSEPNRVDVIFHKTAIVSIYDTNEIVIDNDGFYTKTTKDRIDTILGFLFQHKVGRPRLFQTNHDWFVTELRGTKIEFFNGMVLDHQGRCINYWSRTA